MAQFDVYSLHGPAPYAVQVQSDLLDSLATRAVIPLYPLAANTPISKLHPTITIDGQPFALITAQIASVKANMLTVPVLSLAHSHRQAIIDALDFLLAGA